jgi:TetR/AcrR family transcriptional regulator
MLCILEYTISSLESFNRSVKDFCSMELMGTKKKSKQGKKNRSAEIMKAAEELLGEVGYDGVSIRDIALRAGVNKALIFYYYNSKDELYERVLDRYYSAHQEALEHAFKGQGSFRERFHRMVDSYIDFIVSHERYPRLIQRLIAGGPTQGDKRIEQIRRQLGPLFKWTQQILHEVAPAAGPLSAKHFFVSFSGMVINYFTYGPILGPLWGQDPLSEDSINERRGHLHWMVDTLLNGLRDNQQEEDICEAV